MAKTKCIMKRRKLIGLILIIATFVYFIAFLLALYQNQRVTLEKGMEEALKAYTNQESIDIKELSKDFNLLLDEKMDLADGKQQIVKFEGSFDRMEKNITNVSNEIGLLEYNISSLNEKIETVEKYYENMYHEYQNNFSIIEEQMSLWNKTIKEIDARIINIEKGMAEFEDKINKKIDSKILESTKQQDKKLEEMNVRITNIEKSIIEFEDRINKKIDTKILESSQQQDKKLEEVKSQLEDLKAALTQMKNNVMYYRYNEETGTLHVFGDGE